MGGDEIGQRRLSFAAEVRRFRHCELRLGPGGKMKRFALSLVLVLIVALAAPACAFAVVTSNDFYWSSSSVTKGYYAYGNDTQHLVTYILADGYLEMLLPASQGTPTYYSGNVPRKSFVKKYHSSYGGTAWCYNSGTIWYSGTYDISLKAKQLTTTGGSFKGMGGGTGYIPDVWDTAWLTVK